MDMILENKCRVFKNGKNESGTNKVEKGNEQTNKLKARWQYGCVGRMGVGAYWRLLLPETWPPEPAWALDEHVEQFTVMEL